MTASVWENKNMPLHLREGKRQSVQNTCQADKSKKSFQGVISFAQCRLFWSSKQTTANQTSTVQFHFWAIICIQECPVQRDYLANQICLNLHRTPGMNKILNFSELFQELHQSLWNIQILVLAEINKCYNTFVKVMKINPMPVVRYMTLSYHWIKSSIFLSVCLHVKW